MAQETRLGTLTIYDEEIGTTVHEGRDGWTFHALWKPGMGHDALRSVLLRVWAEGEAARSKQIGELLGIIK